MSPALPVIQARSLSKRYGDKLALDNASFEVGPGRIVGLIGPNGAGKTTAINTILGLIPADGALSVLGLDPFRQRNALMEQVCFIADVAVLPRWIKVNQIIDFVRHIHPQFRPERCEDLMRQFDLPRKSRVSSLSKGMITQLHLALVMAIDARLLVLDEPTLGLDIVSRKHFYDHLINDYMDQERTILVSTHQVEEIENILTDLLFINRGKIVLDMPMDELPNHYVQLVTDSDKAAQARALGPIAERNLLGRCVFIYENADQSSLAALGEIRHPSVADLFVAKMQPRTVS